jgi:hypothetical protein
VTNSRRAGGHHMRYAFDVDRKERIVLVRSPSLARDGREHAIKLLDTLNAPEFDPWTLVDARLPPKQPAGVTPEDGSRARAGKKLKPSDGLEPSTPSLPCCPQGQQTHEE